MASGQRLQLGTYFYYSMTVNRQTEWQFSPRQRTFQLYQLPEYSTVMALFIPCPDFSSVYSIHIMIDGTMTPVVCALLPRMSQLVYSIFATLLQERMLRLNLQFTPTRAFVDFEIVVHNATRQVIPGVTFKGCFFHFTLCILKKRDNRTVNIIPRQWRVQNAFDVQLSYRWYPLDCIEDGFFQVLEDLEDADIPHETQPITHYIAEKWIEGDRLVWNHFGTDGPCTRNNIVECWNDEEALASKYIHHHTYFQGNTNFQWHQQHPKRSRENHSTTCQEVSQRCYPARKIP